jgi:hypothetical protein
MTLAGKLLFLLYLPDSTSRSLPMMNSKIPFLTEAGIIP